MHESRNIEYTYFNKVSSIKGSIDKDMYNLSIVYGPDQQKVKNVSCKNGDVIKTKYYSPGFEKEVTTSTTREISYISSPYGLVAINIRQNSADSLYFVDTDHLGSILALIRNNGTTAAEYSYDEWGRRRRPTNWARYDTIPNIGFIDRGYTGHEHYDIFGLIDMNGRVYDPVIGRFLSPDPVIQFPGFTQSYNSYSYCFNNPLLYIDPNGYNMKIPWKQLWEKIKNIFKNQNTDASNPEPDEPIDTGEESSLPYLPVGGGNFSSNGTNFLPDVIIKGNNSSDPANSTLILPSFGDVPNGFTNIPIAIQENYSSQSYVIPPMNDELTLEIRGKVKIGGNDNIIQFNQGKITLTTSVTKYLKLSFSKDNLGIQIQYDLNHYSIAYGTSLKGMLSVGIMTTYNNYTQSYCFSYTQNLENWSMVGLIVISPLAIEASLPWFYRFIPAITF